ncbi:hypothetical protein Lalb_Chr07g0189661 [Lupinus albus]|uniref:Uncharacterized protein n=1 Tax=Lupinus albus TaxID=3870 RepID=A0A6A4Q944_LUPAL|nr:hypothetical protein Lalb_Chr07g0189661 [Lupinus albus]
MACLGSLFTPLKKLWTRLHSKNKKRKGISILYQDVMSCPSEDVHVLWSMLVESGSAHHSSRSK